uniref:Uncharacterized protein n=1 Tax=Haptolina ericina TaxID=156174 RepID=A0A7S3AH58_9EUKA|mmetsp:Transcript_18596/g.41567  ORF Transcript_18596/g.41567 Transcript_18596/m.41567 type:complete len:188 (+) Transcript_18596:25-588(+)
MVSFVKVAYFFVERAAEPLSARLETHAARSERFRMLCGRIANAYNNLDHNKQQRRAHRDSALHPQPHERIELEPPPTLSEPDATALGCQLLGEGFVIGVGLALLIHQEARERSDALEQQQQLDAWADALEWQQRRVQVLEETQASLIARVEQSEARKVELEASLQRAAPRSAADSIPWLGSFLAAWR